jgi:hypothetical protein
LLAGEIATSWVPSAGAKQRPTDAAPHLQHAREIFERLRAARALAETDALLEQATALNS